jgi:hypothetical protein
MRRVMRSLCLGGAILAAPTTLDFSPALNVHRDVSIAFRSNASPSSPVQLTEIVGLRCEQDEVHAVVVDMPQVISLAYASPETWGSLPMPVEPYEQPPATPGFQLATNEVKHLRLGRNS